MKHDLIEEAVTHSVIGALYEVYNKLGFGFLESVYVSALQHELMARGHCVAREVSFQISYKGHVLGIQRIDMIIDEKLIVETKSTPGTAQSSCTAGIQLPTGVPSQSWPSFAFRTRAKVLSLCESGHEESVKFVQSV